MSITIKDALQMDFLSECKLVAGKSATGNVIQYTDSMEVPDIQPWLFPNLLMLTTGYSLRGNKDGLLKLIHDMKAANCAGLAIKTKFIGEYIDDLILAANKENLPLIILPNDMPSAHISVPLLKLIYDEQNASIKSNYLFLDLITKNYDSEHSVMLRATALGWPTAPYRLIVFSKEGETSERYTLSDIQEKFSHALQNATYISGSENITAILSIEDAPDVKRLISAFTACTPENLEIPLRIGISAPVNCITDFHAAFQDAMDAIKIGKIKETYSIQKDKAGFAISAIENNRLEQGLLSLKSDTNFTKCIEESFSAIRKYDSANNSNLYRTLCVYVTNMGKKAKTAEILFLHRNTLLYRISKIEELTGYDLSDSDTILRLALLVKLEKYVN